jgi:hypothetical protein
MSDHNVLQLYSVDYVQMLQAACKAKDAEIAALQAATRKVVEAALDVLNEYSPEHMDYVSLTDCGSKLRDSLADPVIVALRRE